MEIGVEVGAAVFNDRQTEIGVSCFDLPRVERTTPLVAMP